MLFRSYRVSQPGGKAFVGPEFIQMVHKMRAKYGASIIIRENKDKVELELLMME